MQSNLMEKDVVENKRLSTATSVSISVATSASPSLLSETSNTNSVLSKSPAPSSVSNYSNNGSNIASKDSKSDDKKKLKKVIHKFLNKTKIFSSGHHHSHSKRKSYARSLNSDNGTYDKNVYGYSSSVNEKGFFNATANLNKNANTVSTSQPILYSNNKNDTNQSTIANNFLTIPNNTQLPMHLKEEKENIRILPNSYFNSKEYEEKLLNETEKNMCSGNFTAKEFAAEVGIPIIEEDEENEYYTNSGHLHHSSCSSCYTANGIQNTYCSSKSYGPRLDMSIFEPPTPLEKLNQSSKSSGGSLNKLDSSSKTLNGNEKTSLETIFDPKNEEENTEMVKLESTNKSVSLQRFNEVNEMRRESKDNSLSIPTRKLRPKKLSRFEIEVLGGKPSKETYSHPLLNSVRNNSTYSNYNLSTTYSLPNLNDLNSITRNGNGFHTTPSSPARRDYGLGMGSERNDNVYFNVGGCNSLGRRPRRVSLSKHITSVSSLEEPKKSRLHIIIDSPEEKEQNNVTSSASSSTSSVSPLHFEVKHQNSSSSTFDVFNLNANDSLSRNMEGTHNINTTTIITPDTNDTNASEKDDISERTTATNTTTNIPSAEELKNIWIDKTLGCNSNHVNKYHITNFQTEISKADKTIHTTTTSHIQNCMTNVDSVVFPIQIIKTPVDSKCNTCLKDAKILNTTILCKQLGETATPTNQSTVNTMENPVRSGDAQENTMKAESLNNVSPTRIIVGKENDKSALLEAVTNAANKANEEAKDASPEEKLTEKPTEKSKDKGDKESEDGSNVVQVIQKGRFTVMKEHHDYKHAVPHHYKFVIIRNPSSNVLNSSAGSTAVPSLDGGLPVNQPHKETLSTIITPATLPSLNVSPPESPSSRSPSLSTISIPHQQLANIAAASLSSNLNLSEGIAYTTTIDSNCDNCKSNECNKNEEHVLIVPTKDEKENNLTCIHSFTSSTTPISSSLYISTITPVEASLAANECTLKPTETRTSSTSTTTTALASENISNPTTKTGLTTTPILEESTTEFTASIIPVDSTTEFATSPSCPVAESIDSTLPATPHHKDSTGGIAVSPILLSELMASPTFDESSNTYRTSGRHQNSETSLLSKDLTSSTSSILFNRASNSSTSTYHSVSRSADVVENTHGDPQPEPKLEPSEVVTLPASTLAKEVKSSPVLEAAVAQPMIPTTCTLKSNSTILCESKPPLSPPIYPTLNSTVTLVNNSTQNIIQNQNSILSEDLSIYTNYSDDTCIHSENDLCGMKMNTTSTSKLCEEINHEEGNVRSIPSIPEVQPLQHSETEFNNEISHKDLVDLRKTQSVQYPEDAKIFNYSYNSLDRDGSLNILEPVEIEDGTTGQHGGVNYINITNNINAIGAISRSNDIYKSTGRLCTGSGYDNNSSNNNNNNSINSNSTVRPSLNKLCSTPSRFEVSQDKVEREIVTSPYFSKDPLNRKKYFPTHSYDQDLHPQEAERKDSYYEEDEPESSELSSTIITTATGSNDGQSQSQSLERKHSELSMNSSLDPSYRSTLTSHNEFERTRAYSVSSVCGNECPSSKYTHPLGSMMSTTSTVGTTSTGTTSGTTVGTIGKDSHKMNLTNSTTTTTGTDHSVHPIHPHYPHHHHFFVISNSDADVPTNTQIKYNNEFNRDSNSSTRVVISSRQHRKFDITTSSGSSKPSLISTKSITNNNSSTNLLQQQKQHRRSPSNSSNISSHSSRFIVTREPSKNVNINDKSPLSSATSVTPRKQSRFTVTRQAIN